jgi:hypothetical protein
MKLNAEAKRVLKSLPADCSWIEEDQLINCSVLTTDNLFAASLIEIQGSWIGPKARIAITPLGLKAIGRRRKKSRAPKSPAKSPMHSP